MGSNDDFGTTPPTIGESGAATARPRGTALGRRGFVVAGGVAAAVTFPLASLFSRAAPTGGFGPLVEDPSGILDLPAGFSYTIVERKFATMTDGFRVPALPDGMACFPGAPGTLVVMRNHEVAAGAVAQGAYGAGEAPKEAYDAGAYGAVTRVVVDAKTGERIASNLVLTGTLCNCAGGVSPWGWLSCEETTDEGHGYVFLCRTDAESVQPFRRVSAYGRFNHEAACIDAVSNVCYMTEDRRDGCVYRFVPDDPSEPFVGTLQALRVVGRDRFATTDMDIGDSVDVQWVEIRDPEPAGDTVRGEGQDRGAALFVNGEGMWFHEGEVWICSTNGGPKGSGQIFRLADGRESGTLTLVTQSTDRDELHCPDQITVAPWGQVFMAEDGRGNNFVRLVGQDGTVAPFARNAGSESEIAGVCFSPDGSIMFLNLHTDGLTLAITGRFPTVG